MTHPNERQKETETPRIDARIELKYPVMSMAADKDHLVKLHRDVIDNLRTELRQARAEGERLKRDGERLDWLLDGNMWQAVHSAPHGHAYVIMDRDAIDSAMAEGGAE